MNTSSASSLDSSLDSCARANNRTPSVSGESEHLSTVADQCAAIGEHLLNDLFYVNNNGWCDDYDERKRIDVRLEEASATFYKFMAEVRLRIRRAE